MTNKNFGSSAGLTILAEDPDTQASGMVSYITSSYQTGWMPGDIKLAALSDTDDTDLVGGTDADRSVNGNDLTVNGTVTRTAVASGADLVSYSGFSASNYLEQPYNSDLDFGTGDFCVMGWAKPLSTSSQAIMDRGNADGATDTNRFVLLHLSGSGWQFFIKGGAGETQNLTVGSNAATNVWQHVCAVRIGGSLHLYVNGSLANSAASTARTVTNANAVTRVGLAFNTTSLFNGDLALLRISATAPTAEQIKKIYEDERKLFQEGAACTLYGSSDAVTALAHDPDTGLLHVGTSAGRSVFKGLRRVDNTTDAVTTAISASNGLVVDQ